MTETWGATVNGWRRLRTALANADEDTRYSFAFWTIGLAMMTTAIVLQFGWLGVLFCAGLLLWKVSGL